MLSTSAYDTCKMILVSFALLLVVTFGLPFAARTQTPPDDTVYRLQGVVENALTGKPLSRALVTSVDRRLATMTDDKGHFSLLIDVPILPQGASALGMGGVRAFAGPLGASRSGASLLLTASKPGYLQPQQATMLPLDATLATDSIELKLMPAGIIQGSVSTDLSDAPHGVRVMLLHRQVQEGRYQWVQNGMQMTDGRGRFRFDDLRPGEYTVMSMEWAGGQPLVRPRLEPSRQYPPLFLGDVRDLPAAAKLQLHNGETLHAELDLQPATYYPVSVPVSLSRSEGGVNVRVLSGGGFNGFALGFNVRTQAVEGTLPNGAYTLLITRFGPQPVISALVSIQVAGGPLRTGPVALSPAASIPVHIHPELTQQQGSNQRYLNIFLRPEEPGTAGATIRPNPETPDELTIENVLPGRYFLETMPSSSGYAASITSGNVNLLEQPLVVSAGAQPDPIEVVLRDDFATLTGSVTGLSGAPPRNCFVLLLPTGSSGQIRQGMAYNGSFKLNAVSPGTYLLIATPQVAQDIPYRDPDAMQAYAGIGATVILTSGQQARADAPFVDQIAQKEQ